MTTMAEIEKAVDDVCDAVRLLEDTHYLDNSVCDYKEQNKRIVDVRLKREHLMQLIEWLAQYQPREVSNDCNNR
jgi:hypothetical protein